MNPELFARVGIKPPKGVLLYGPPGAGKTLLARAVAATLSTNFLKVVASAIVDKYIGESARVVREMFAYAKEHEPCLVVRTTLQALCYQLGDPCLTLSLSCLRAVHRRNRRDRRSTILRGYFSGPRDPANFDGAAEPA